MADQKLSKQESDVLDLGDDQSKYPKSSQEKSSQVKPDSDMVDVEDNQAKDPEPSQADSSQVKPESAYNGRSYVTKNYGNNGEYAWGDIDWQRPLALYSYRKQDIYKLLVRANRHILAGVDTLPGNIVLEIWPYLVYPPIPQWFMLPLAPKGDHVCHDLSLQEQGTKDAFFGLFRPNRRPLKGNKYFRNLLIPLWHYAPLNSRDFKGRQQALPIWSMLHFDKDTNTISWYALNKWQADKYARKVRQFVSDFPAGTHSDPFIQSAREVRPYARDEQGSGMIYGVGFPHDAEFKAFVLGDNAGDDNERREAEDTATDDFITNVSAQSLWAAVHAARFLMLRGMQGNEIPLLNAKFTTEAKTMLCVGINDLMDHYWEGAYDGEGLIYHLYQGSRDDEWAQILKSAVETITGEIHTCLESYLDDDPRPERERMSGGPYKPHEPNLKAQVKLDDDPGVRDGPPEDASKTWRIARPSPMMSGGLPGPPIVIGDSSDEQSGTEAVISSASSPNKRRGKPSEKEESPSKKQKAPAEGSP